MNAEQYTVLHGLYIKKYADAGVVAHITGLSRERVETTLKSAMTQGKVSEVADRYTLTPIARVAHLASCSRYFAGQRSDIKFIEAYDKFEEINVDLKTVITDWQTRQIAGRVLPNDHSDASYDNAVIDRLGRVHEKAEKVLRSLSAALPRLKLYLERLEAAIEKAESGRPEWVAEVKIDSYHTVWFELHEDLLCILGRQRQE